MTKMAEIVGRKARSVVLKEQKAKKYSGLPSIFHIDICGGDSPIRAWTFSSIAVEKHYLLGHMGFLDFNDVNREIFGVSHEFKNAQMRLYEGALNALDIVAKRMGIENKINRTKYSKEYSLLVK